MRKCKPSSNIKIMCICGNNKIGVGQQLQWIWRTPRCTLYWRNVSDSKIVLDLIWTEQFSCRRHEGILIVIGLIYPDMHNFCLVRRPQHHSGTLNWSCLPLDIKRKARIYYTENFLHFPQNAVGCRPILGIVWANDGLFIYDLTWYGGCYARLADTLG